MKKIKNFFKNWYYGAYRRSNLAIKNYEDLQEAKQRAGVVSEEKAFQKMVGYKDPLLFTNYLKLIKSRAEKDEQALKYDKTIEKYEMIYEISNENNILGHEDISEIVKKLNGLIQLKYLKNALIRAGRVGYCRELSEKNLKYILNENDTDKRIKKFKELFYWKADIIKEANGAVAILTGSTIIAFNGDTMLVEGTGYFHNSRGLSNKENPEITYVGKDGVAFQYEHGCYGRKIGGEFVIGTGRGSDMHWWTERRSFKLERPQNLNQLRYKEKADCEYQNGNIEHAAEIYILAGQYDKAAKILTKIKKKFEERQKENLRLAKFRSLPTPKFRNTRTENPYDYNPGKIPSSLTDSIEKTRDSIESIERKTQLVEKLSIESKSR